MTLSPIEWLILACFVGIIAVPWIHGLIQSSGQLHPWQKTRRKKALNQLVGLGCVVAGASLIYLTTKDEAAPPGPQRDGIRPRLNPENPVGHPLGQSQLPDFEPYGKMGEEMFASRVIAHATVPRSVHKVAPGEAPHYGANSMLGVALRNVRKNERYVVTIIGDRFVNESTETVTIEQNADVVVAQPWISYDYAAIRKATQTTTFNLTFKVRREDQPEVRSITRIWQLHQINDCPFFLNLGFVQADGSIRWEGSTHGSTYAGFVNENHPWINSVLVEARATQICGDFIGYQGGTEKVWPQIAAIWKALENRGLGYSSIATTTNSRLHSMQHVRFIDESLTTRQANCVDGSVLMASILRKIGLNVGIMLVPSHAYVTIGDQKNEHFLYAIETTLLGKSDLNTAVKAASTEEPYSLANLSREPEKHKGDLYRFIDIGKQRKIGIQPIPFEGPVQPAGPMLSLTAEPTGSPAEVARQQRIIVAEKLRQRARGMEARLDSKQGGNIFNIHDEDFRLAAYALFAEIRNHQSAFNKLRPPPPLSPIGITETDQILFERYGRLIQTLRSGTLDSNLEIRQEDVRLAVELAEALFGIASLPLEY